MKFKESMGINSIFIFLHHCRRHGECRIRLAQYCCTSRPFLTRPVVQRSSFPVDLPIPLVSYNLISNAPASDIINQSCACFTRHEDFHRSNFWKSMKSSEQGLFRETQWIIIVDIWDIAFRIVSVIYDIHISDTMAKISFPLVELRRQNLEISREIFDRWPNHHETILSTCISCHYPEVTKVHKHPKSLNKRTIFTTLCSMHCTSCQCCHVFDFWSEMHWMNSEDISRCIFEHWNRMESYFKKISFCYVFNKTCCFSRISRYLLLNAIQLRYDPGKP